MASRIVRSLKWRRWSGPLSAIVDAAEAAASELRAWSENEPTPQVAVEAALPQLVMHFMSVEELARDLPAYELPSLQSVRITVSAWTKPDPDGLIGQRFAVSFRLQPASPSLSMEIDGTDRVRVEGLAERMRETLDHAQSGPSIRSDDVMWIIPFGYLFGVVGIYLIFPKTPFASLIAPLVAGIVAMVAAGWLFPGLELLAPGQTSRYQKFRGVAVVVVIGLVTSWIFAVFQNRVHI